MQIVNPFGHFRSEHASDASVAELFVKPGFLSEVARDSAVVIRGGRGTGKTTILKYLSFDVQSLEYEKRSASNTDLVGFFGNTHAVGIYYRLNTASFSLLKGHEWPEEKWVFFFAHYLNLILIQKVWDFVVKVFQKRATASPHSTLVDLGNNVMAILRLDAPDSVENVPILLRKEQARLESFFIQMAYSNPELPLNLTLPGQPVFEFCELLTNSVPELSECVFHIMLDEFENLLDYQQRVVNTLVKHTRHPVFFKVAGRHYGFRTSDTLNAKERIEDGQDYVLIDLEKAISPTAYRNLLKKICRKRLEATPFFRENKLTDIESILQTISPEEEAIQACSSKPRRQRQKIVGMVKYQGGSVEQASSLHCEQNPLLERLNYALLCRGRSVQEVAAAYSGYLSGEQTDVVKWYAKTYKKTQPNLLFQLLRDERGGRKKYAGFDVLADLSSGIIRKFIEICHRAFQFSLDEFEPDEDQVFAVSVEHQTEAVHNLSQSLFNSIASDIPDKGSEVQMFMKRLGLLFKLLNLEDEAVSKPARSYFSTFKATIDSDTLDLLRVCVMHSVLFERIGWKGNRVEHGRPDDFLFNRLLTPFFEMPYRGFDRTLLSVDDLKSVYDGYAKTVAARLLRKNALHSPSQLSLDDLVAGQHDEEVDD